MPLLKFLIGMLLCSLCACAQPIDDEVPALPIETLAPESDVLVQVSAAWLAFRSVDYVGAVAAAAEQWNTATAGRVHIHLELSDSDNGAGVWLRPATAADVAADRVGSWSLGSTACVGCYPVLILLNAGVIGQRSEAEDVPEPELIAATAAHELGHMLGLNHLESGLMVHDNSNGTRPCIDAITLSAFCELRGCPPAAAPTCL